jgi:multidrug transporter EmrE-like cation transporter
MTSAGARGPLLPSVVLTAACSAGGIALIKAGLGGAGVALLLAGLVLYAAGIALGVVMVARHPVSVVYPAVVGLALAAVAVIATVWLGEPMNAAKVAGTLLVVAGVYVLATAHR